MTDALGQPAAQPERERAISERAYAIWDEEGQPGGKHLEHWLRAEQEHEDRGGSAPSPDQGSGRARTAAPRRAHEGTGGRAAGASGKETGPSSQAGQSSVTRQLQEKA